MHCTHCGHVNPADANYCVNCGRPVVSDPHTTGQLGDHSPPESAETGGTAAGVEAIVDELEPGTALLASVGGWDEGAQFLLDQSHVSVGRHPDSDLFLDDITVSRRHAEFRRDGNGFTVHDVGSLNGTYVNGQRAETHSLSTGDEVQIGKFKLVVFIGEPRE